MLKFTMGKVLKRNSVTNTDPKSISWQRSKASLDALGEKIREYQHLNEDPEIFIKNSILKLREQLENDMAISIKKINEHYLELSERLDQIESDCIDQCKASSRESVEAEVEENYVKMRKNLDILMDEDVMKQDTIISNCNRYYLQLEKMIEDLKSDLFLNKTIHYRQNIDGLKYSLESVEIITEPAKQRNAFVAMTERRK